MKKISFIFSLFLVQGFAFKVNAQPIQPSSTEPSGTGYGLSIVPLNLFDLLKPRLIYAYHGDTPHDIERNSMKFVGREIFARPALWMRPHRFFPLSIYGSDRGRANAIAGNRIVGTIIIHEDDFDIDKAFFVDILGDFEILPHPFQRTRSSYSALDVSRRGSIVGWAYCSDVQQTFAWYRNNNNNRFYRLASPLWDGEYDSASYVEARAIDFEDDTTVGNYIREGNRYRACIWRGTSGIASNLPGTQFLYQSYASDYDQGLTVGMIRTTAQDPWIPVLWDDGDEPIGVYASSGTAKGICKSNRGNYYYIVGESSVTGAFLVVYDATLRQIVKSLSLNDVFPLEGRFTSANAVNANGDIVCEIYLNGVNRRAVYIKAPYIGW